MDDGWGCVSLVKYKENHDQFPQQLLKEVDGVVEKENSNRSDFIRRAMKLYLTRAQETFDS